MGSDKQARAAAISTNQESWQRARRPEQKQQRQSAIVAAARTLVDDGGVEHATLSAIAKSAGISKANCYRYYESREAILLDVFLQEAQDHTRCVVQALSAHVGSNDVDATATIIVRNTVARPRLLNLVSVLWSVLERNISEALITDFKRQFHTLSAEWARVINLVHPKLTQQQAEVFASCHLMFISSAWQAANPPPAVAAVMQRAEFCGSRIEFQPLLQAHTLNLLKGMLAEH